MKNMHYRKTVLMVATLAFVLVGFNSVSAQETSKVDQIIYHPKPMKSVDVAKETISRILNDNCVSIIDTTISEKKLKYKRAAVFNEGIQLTLKSGTDMISFSKLFGESDIYLSGHHILIYDAKTGERYRDYYYDRIVGTGNIVFSKYKAGFGVTMPNPSMYPKCNEDLADALYTIQRKLNSSRHEVQMDEFKVLAEKYRSLKEKPIPTEEQRKYVVQGTFFAKQKNFDKAVELYQKALSIDKTAFPIVYFDLANVYANTNNYSAAIFYMKEYLMLIPDSSAREAKDKVYEWETMVNPAD